MMFSAADTSRSQSGFIVSRSLMQRPAVKVIFSTFTPNGRLSSEGGAAVKAFG